MDGLRVTLAASASTPIEPISSAARWEISDQLDRVLASPWFRTSSRCSQLLRHVVEMSIHGQCERLKERQIAVEVFHRKPSYDNNADPVVRVAAGEVRKRLAQYYGASESAGQVRIELPIGSYVPAFHVPPPPTLSAVEALSATEGDQVSTQRPEPVVSLPDSPRRVVPALFRLRWAWLTMLAVALLVVCAVWLWRGLRPGSPSSGFDTFWAPLFSAVHPPVISVGELYARELTFIPDPQRRPHSSAFDVRAAKDLPKGIPVEHIGYFQAIAKIASMLGTKSKPFDLLDQSDTTFADITGRPEILLGAYDNDWSMGLVEGRRFEFKADYARGLQWISDRQKPGLEIGSRLISSTAPASYDAYAIVIRETGILSGQTHVLLAGLGDQGTVSAAEFVSNPRYLDDFARHAPSGWAGKNIEILIRTRVLEGVLGIPTVVDYSTW